MEEPVNQETSVQAAEDRTMDLIFPELKAHLSYLNDVYNLTFHVQTHLDGQRIADIPHLARAQYMIRSDAPHGSLAELAISAW
jgi:hypothetical protein